MKYFRNFVKEQCVLRFIYNQTDTNMKLLQIAAQCPWEAGRAVYHARSLYSLIKDTVFVNACNSVSGLSRGDGSGEEALEIRGEKKHIKRNNSFVVYPNPVRELLQITYQTAQDAHLTIYNIYGAKVSEYFLPRDSQSEIINMQDYLNGVYFLRIYDENANELFTQKLIISK